MDAPAGSLVVYATAPGNVAEDGGGRNGVFTGALLNHIATPGLDAEIMLRRVRKDVVAKTKGRQVPWTSSSLQSGFSFAGEFVEQGKVSAPANVTASAPEVVVKPVFVLTIKGVSDASNPISRRVFAEKNARRKLKRAVIRKLMKSPYSLTRSGAQKVYDAGEQLDFYYEDGGSSVVLEYEFDTRKGR